MSDKLEIKIDVIIHATEDIKKFHKAFEGLFGIKEDQFTIQEMTGHFDNPIIMLGTKITGDTARKIIEKISSKISEYEKEEILESLEQRTEGSGMYMRLDKQEFVQGNIIPEQKNAIKLRVYTPVYQKREIIEAYKALLDFHLN